MECLRRSFSIMRRKKKTPWHPNSAQGVDRAKGMVRLACIKKPWPLLDLDEIAAPATQLA